jgi:hypothetical protein
LANAPEKEDGNFEVPKVVGWNEFGSGKAEVGTANHAAGVI